MAFNADFFKFNGVSCDAYDLVLLNFDNVAQDTDGIVSSTEIVSDKLHRRYDSIYYGSSQNKPLEFNLVFGKNPCKKNISKDFTRQEIAEISTWLTTVDGYKWLEIMQDDLSNVRYKCIIKEVKVVTRSWKPYAFNCKVQCDSPFAYQYPDVTNISVNNTTKTTNITNTSSYDGYYYPIIEITPNSSDVYHSLIIKNESDGGREFEITDIPLSAGSVFVDCRNGVIANQAGINVYSGFNFNFLRLKRGVNTLKTTGKCNVKITCEYPVAVGT